MTRHLTIRIYGTERLALWGLMTGTSLCVALYLYFLASSVSSIVLRQETAQQIRVVGGEVSSLEARYLAKKESITPEMAQNLGFVPVADAEKVFLASVQAPTLSFNSR